jgi:CRP-like cAMP-binding protein
VSARPLNTTARATVRAVPWLASLGEEALGEVIDAGQIVTFGAGQPLVRELEIGDCLYVILEGTADVTASVGHEAPIQLKTLGAGDACGEMALLTRELRSATVTAISEVHALRLEKLEFDVLLARHPRIAVHFAREVAARLVDADRALDALLDDKHTSGEETRRLSGIMAAVTPTPGSLVRAWRELVASRRQELPFLAMAAFLGTLVNIRIIVWAFQAAGADLFGVLRAAYTTGIALLMLSVATSLVRFSPGIRKLIAVCYGVGFALIFNELSVFLAFDTFYLDMTTRDRDMVFSVEALYRRSESQWAVGLALLVLVQATYLRRFYKRSAFILATRLRGMLSRS